MNKAGIELLKHFESLNDDDLSRVGLQPKRDCGGIWTAGWGHALKTKDGSRFLTGSADKAEAYACFPEMTEDQAEELLQSDLVKFERHVDEMVKVEINENQHAALTSFAFNCGEGNFHGSTLLKKLNAGDYESAADHFLDWNKGRVHGVMTILKGLTLRREAERKLFLTGV
jgi:lysozyme